VNRGRFEIFSDAVFAVAITLLALNLTIPGRGHGPLTGQLIHQWQPFVAYLISFFTIGTIWANHHSLVSNIAFVNRPLLFCNLVLLAFVVLIPPATKLLADYLPAAGLGSHLAAAVYGMALEGMAIGFTLILEWTLREGHTEPSVPPDRRWAVRLRYLPGPVAYLAVIGTAFIHPLLALSLSGAIDVYYAFEQTPLLARGRGSARPGSRERTGGHRAGRQPGRPGNAIRGGSRTRHAALRPVQTRRRKPTGFRQ
jgi:uncharacterized membrane protein